MTLQHPCVCLALLRSWMTKVYGSCCIACAITILSSRVVKVWRFLVYDRAAVLEGVIMWDGSFGPHSGDVFIDRSHIVLRLSPELGQSPGGFPLGDLETLGHLLVKPSKESDVTGAVTQVCALESLNFNFVFDAFHLLDD